jgi:uncharacterized protein (TIGR02246 family)
VNARTALLIVAAMALTAYPAPAREPVEEAAITALVKRYAEAREKQSRERIRELFTADADQLVSSGEWRRGPDALVEGMLASSARTGARRTLTVERIRMLGPTVAVADARYEITAAASGTRKMWSTFIVLKTTDGWRIAAIRNMLPAPPG